MTQKEQEIIESKRRERSAYFSAKPIVSLAEAFKKLENRKEAK